MQYNGSGSFGTLDPDKNGKMDPVTLQSEKMEVWEGHLGAFEGPNQEKVNGRIRIRIKLDKVRIRSRVKGRIRIRIKAKSRITLMRIRNTDKKGRNIKRKNHYRYFNT
jgi:hypothetical protein